MEDKTTETIQAAIMGTQTGTEDTKVQTGTSADIAKIEAAIEGLKTAGEDLFKDEITALETKKAALVAELENQAKAAETEAITVVTTTKTTYEKYVKEPLFILAVIGIAYIAFKLN